MFNSIYERAMKTFIITIVTLATVCFIRHAAAQGVVIVGPPSGWPPGEAWPPMPVTGLYPPVVPPSPCPPIAIPPELVLPNHGVFATTAGLSPIPEPATCSLLLLGGGMAAWLIRRRRV